MRRHSLTLACMALAACQTTPPKTITVVVEKVVQVPPELTVPCAVYRAKRQVVGEAIRGHNSNVASLEECNARMEQIRKLVPVAGP